jgi:hypothetical protein
LATSTANTGEGFEVIHTPPSLPCPYCPHLVEVRPIQMSFFEGQLQPCPRCSTPVDSYELILQTLLRGGFDFWVLSVVRARRSLFPLTLQPREVFVLRLTDYEIPPDARIIGVSYTCQWNETPFLFPVEMLGNRPIKYTEPMERNLFPVRMPIHAEGEPKATIVHTDVTWVPNPKVDVIWDLLVEAFHRFYLDQIEGAIIPANTAVEVAIGQLLTERIERVVSARRTEELLKNGATYGHQINVLLPLLVRLKGIPPLPERIQKHLGQLNTLRNALAHTGKPKKILAKGEVAECLTAALLAIHYADLVRPKLLEG